MALPTNQDEWAQRLELARNDGRQQPWKELLPKMRSKVDNGVGFAIAGKSPGSQCSNALNRTLGYPSHLNGRFVDGDLVNTTPLNNVQCAGQSGGIPTAANRLEGLVADGDLVNTTPSNDVQTAGMSGGVPVA